MGLSLMLYRTTYLEEAALAVGLRRTVHAWCVALRRRPRDGALRRVEHLAHLRLARTHT